MPIDIFHLRECIAEAQRFVKRAKTCLGEMEVIKAQKSQGFNAYGYPDPVKSAAVRRSSMDLTRALAQLRRV